MMYFRRIAVVFFLVINAKNSRAQRTEESIRKIDSVVVNAIRNEAFPGCVIYAMSGDTVLFEKAYGFHTYDSAKAVQLTDIYDLASVTKATAATLALMKLYDRGLIRPDDELRTYVKGMGKVGKLTFRECLAHQSGLPPWIPYYREVKKKNGTFKPKTIAFDQSEDYDFALSDSLFLHKDFYRKIKKMIRKSNVSDVKKYRYSGLFFYLVPEVVENLSGLPMNAYLRVNFYDSLGATTLGFRPLDRFAKEQIVPTENDRFFRFTRLHGRVHDEGAITMRGVSGNAGLFGNARDLSTVWQMLLKKGAYRGKRYLSPQTIELFTTAQYPNNGNRRGMGFDKPLLTYHPESSSVAQSASFRSFGHSGFTGTLVWVDPETELLFIFLSNRVYPTRENRNLYRLNVRPTIHQFLYDMQKKKKNADLQGDCTLH